MKRNENGFSIVEVLLILVIVGLVGFVGWYVWHAKQGIDKNLKVSNSPTPVVTKRKSTVANPSTVSTPAQTTKYLTIKEWGIRVPYTSTDTLNYTLTSTGTSAEIISNNLSTKYGCTTFGAGLIVRQNPTDIVDPGPGTVAQAAQADPASYKQVGSYYYSFGHDQAACGNIAASAPGQSASAGEQAQQDANTFTSKLIPAIVAIPAQ